MARSINGESRHLARYNKIDRIPGLILDMLVNHGKSLEENSEDQKQPLPERFLQTNNDFNQPVDK